MLTLSFSAARGLQRPAVTPLPVTSSPPPSLSRSLPRRRSRPQPRPPSASFGDDPASLVSNLLDGVLVSAVVGGILLSALPLYSESAGRAARRRAGSKSALAVRGAEDARAESSSSRRTEREIFEAEADLEEEEGLKWGLATVVACLPLVGFTAWAFIAVDEAATSSSSSSSLSSSRAPLYWAFAGIYALASLRHGLSLDAGAVAVALACAAHVQVERASSSFALEKVKENGEGEDFDELFGRKTPAQTAAERATKAAARAAGAAADSAAAVARAVRAGLSEGEEGENEGESSESGESGGNNRKALPADTRRRVPTKEDLADRRYDRDLLRSFDERLREREVERREEGGGTEGGKKRR